MTAIEEQKLEQPEQEKQQAPEPQPNYFLARVQYPGDFGTPMKAMGTLVDEITLDITEHEIHARTMDNSHVALAQLTLPDRAFERWSVTGAPRIGLNLEELLKNLKDFNKKDCLELEFAEYNQILAMKNMEISQELRTVEPGASSTPLPKLSFYTKVRMPTQKLKEVLASLANVGEYVTFESERIPMPTGRVTLSTQGDSGKKAHKLDPSRNADLLAEGLELDIKEDAKATYSLDFLQKLLSAIVPNKGPSYWPEVVIEYSTKMPAKFTFENKEGARLEYYLAPRVQD